MGFLSSIWNGLIEGLEIILRFYEGLLEPISGGYAWGLSIILLTVTVRIFLIPLMVRQTKSMRAMQQLQPELKRIKEKYKADRSMMKTDPERYKKLKEKEREAQMALYQEHQVNPVGGCLPLLLQMPIFFALFTLLRDDSRIAELATAPFIGIDSLSNTAADGAGVGAIALVVLQALTTYYTQKQMQARNTTASGEQAQVQKMMMYIMPVFLAYLSFTFPIGVVLYWVTTNVWTIGQQYYIFKQVEAEEAKAADARAAERRAKRSSKDSGTSDDAPTNRSGKGGTSTGAGGAKGKRPKNAAPSGAEDQSAALTDDEAGGSNGSPAKRKTSNGKTGSGKSGNGKAGNGTPGSPSSKPKRAR